MSSCTDFCDGLCRPALTIRAGQLLGLVCARAGLECPILPREEAAPLLERLAQDPTAALRLTSDADEVAHHPVLWRDPAASPAPGAAVSPAIFDRKRDLDVLQRLGLMPGDTRRARYLFELLFARIETPEGICAYDTPGWEGCPHAQSGGYEGVRADGWQAVVHARTPEEMAQSRRESARRIAEGDRLFVRPHHFMCLACWYAGGEGTGLRPNDTLAEILARIRREPTVPVTLVEGSCEACYCCDGFDPPTTRCTHAGGLIRDYKKDLDVLQKLGLAPGVTLPACEYLQLLFERIASTREICGYGDGIVRAEEWRICSDPEGNPGYAKTRRTGFFA
jgi:hypothetical protein